MNVELEQLLKENYKKDNKKQIDTIILEAINRNISISYEDIYDVQKSLGKNGFITPKIVTDFISSVALTKNEKVLVAWDNFGEWLENIEEGCKKVVLLNQSKERAKITKHLLNEVDKEIIYGDPIEQLSNISNTKFDTILGFPPLGIRVNLEKEQIKLDLNHAVILKAKDHLAENGRMFFIVTDKFFSRNRSNSIINILEKENVFLESAVYLPPGTLHETKIGTHLISLKKNEQKEIFTGELKKNTMQILSNNWKEQKSGKILHLGKFINRDNFRTFNALEKEMEIERIVKKGEFHCTYFKDLIQEIKSISTKHIDEAVYEENSIYIKKTWPFPAKSSKSELEGRNSLYFQLVLKEAVNKTYLIRYLNSRLGKLFLESLKSGIYINKDDLLNAKLYLPSNSNQKRTNQIQNKVEELKNELNEIEDVAWNQPHRSESLIKRLKNINKDEGLTEWIETLPFPLASILYKYYASTNVVAKKDILLHFFEAYAQFQVMLLLSAVTRKDKPIDEKYIYEIDIEKLKLATFGSWVFIGQNIAKKLRSFLNDERAYCLDVFCHNKEDLIKVILSKPIYKILETTNGYRNNWKGHGGVESESKAKERLNALEVELQNLRKVIGNTFEDYYLIRPGEGFYSEGLFHMNCQLLKGSRSTFVEKQLEFINPIDIKNLYLYENGNVEALKLLPFIKMLAGPETQMDACYFYNKIDKNGVKMVSYYFDQDSEVTLENSEQMLSIFNQINNS